MNAIREPAVAGYFYPGAPGELAAAVDALLDAAGERETPAPKALIVPHAGYIYSGPIAASAYALLRPHCNRYRRVILLGPCHRVPIRGLAVCGANLLRTPIGDIPVDHAAIAALDIAGLAIADAPHRQEHSLEVHLPFLQAVLGEFKVVPIAVGDASPELVAEVLDALWGGAETLIVVSSDLSHYLSYADAVTLDAATCYAIEHFDDGGINHTMACGAIPVRGLLQSAERHGLDVTTLDLRNSGDTAGDKVSVVGYGAWMFA